MKECCLITWVIWAIFCKAAIFYLADRPSPLANLLLRQKAVIRVFRAWCALQRPLIMHQTSWAILLKWQKFLTILKNVNCSQLFKRKDAASPNYKLSPWIKPPSNNVGVCAIWPWWEAYLYLVVQWSTFTKGPRHHALWMTASTVCLLLGLLTESCTQVFR